MAKNDYIRVRLSEDEKELVQQAADAFGMTLSEYIRERVVELSRNTLYKIEGKLDIETIVFLDTEKTERWLKDT